MQPLPAQASRWCICSLECGYVLFTWNVRREHKKQCQSRTSSDAKLALLFFCTVFRIGPQSSLLQFSNFLRTWLCHVNVVLIIFFSLFLFFFGLFVFVVFQRFLTLVMITTNVLHHVYGKTSVVLWKLNQTFFQR